MSIKFVCSCGKRLRARDEMARRRSVCPRCGQPVGIPSGEPTHPGTAAEPLTPQERRRLAARRGAGGGETATVPLPPVPRNPPTAPPPGRDPIGAIILGLLIGRKHPRGGASQRRLRSLEAHWYECLAYPLHDWPLWTGPALLLTVVSGAGLLLLPRVFAAPPPDPVVRWVQWSAFLLGLVLVLGFPCNFLGAVLASATAGDPCTLRWTGPTVGAALRGGLAWLTCYLAGPAVFVAAAFHHWRECGDPAFVDWLILAELGFFAVGYGLLVLAAVAERGLLRGVNPLCVIDLAHRLNYRATAAALAGYGLLVAHGVLAVVAAQQLHREPVLGWLLLAAFWLSGMFWATFLFRLLGVWCYRTRSCVSRERETEAGSG
jgi:hypothetical protein